MNTITVITINYNNAKGLQTTIESVKCQTRKDVELIVIDGGSTDASVDIIRRNTEIIDYWVSEPDKGIYDAMNKGISKAKGDYLIFMNSGDCFYDEEVIKTYYDIINALPQVDVFYGDMLVVNNEKIDDWIKRQPGKLTLEFFKEAVINHQASVIKSSLFRQFGTYPLQYKLASDYWLWLISLLHNKCFKHIDLVAVKYDNSGASSKDFSLYAKEMKTIWQALVPSIVHELMVENQNYRKLLRFKLVKLALVINKKYQALKQKL